MHIFCIVGLTPPEEILIRYYYKNFHFVQLEGNKIKCTQLINAALSAPMIILFVSTKYYKCVDLGYRHAVQIDGRFQKWVGNITQHTIHRIVRDAKHSWPLSEIEDALNCTDLS
jgi:hypothetical protein